MNIFFQDELDKSLLQNVLFHSKNEYQDEILPYKRLLHPIDRYMNLHSSQTRYTNTYHTPYICQSLIRPIQMEDEDHHRRRLATERPGLGRREPADETGSGEERRRHLGRRSSFGLCCRLCVSDRGGRVAQSAPLRRVAHPECAFSSHRACRMCLSVSRARRMCFFVECAFPYLGKRQVTSRKSALWAPA